MLYFLYGLLMMIIKGNPLLPCCAYSCMYFAAAKLRLLLMIAILKTMLGIQNVVFSHAVGTLLNVVVG